ncbi:probable acyl-activating enzyme 18, peroxisomal [Jatropha curcas]|uniref:probable acyl-activating enzyme 18, peroxisomal n=1 Tax=Jatropha curcas TaxID=180498 RepID=UPI0005FBEEF7|nr:probable acyl-activating enzyme 18, peroxisomal [Jatropha curcas]
MERGKLANLQTCSSLWQKTRLVANALDAMFTKGDAMAIDMPMTVNAVVTYLATELAGFVVLLIADSFAAKEIASGLHIFNAEAIFTQSAYDTLSLSPPYSFGALIPA